MSEFLYSSSNVLTLSCVAYSSSTVRLSTLEISTTAETVYLKFKPERTVLTVLI